MIDTHCHVFREYYDDIPALINEIKAAGISKIIVNGCDIQSNLEVLDLVKKYDIVYGAIGFHPTEKHDDISTAMSFLEKHINDKKIVAIGEIGLDYHYDDTDKEYQLDLFKRQLNIASKYNKPVIVHTRDAIKDTYDMLKLYNLRGSIHAYSGSLEMAHEFTKLGYYLGIGGVLTYKNAKNIKAVIDGIDLSYILLETDSPYLTPEPYRGKKNTPSNVKIVADEISKIKHINISMVEKITNNNASSLFDF